MSEIASFVCCGWFVSGLMWGFVVYCGYWVDVLVYVLQRGLFSLL